MVELPSELASALARAMWAKYKRPLEERFWSKVQKTETCWLWTAFKNKKGYGIFGLEHHTHGKPGKNVLAPRMAWTLTNGPIPKGQYVLHNCDNPACVRPDHLRLGSHSDNMQEMWDKGRAGDHRKFGEDNGMHRLTNAQVEAIRGLYPALSLAKIAAVAGISESQVRNIIKNRQRTG